MRKEIQLMMHNAVCRPTRVYNGNMWMLVNGVSEIGDGNRKTR